MKPEKRKRCSGYCDRLSEMPDEVLVHILSYMPTIDAVRTMLIRPFGNLWTLLPTLHFNLDEFCLKMGYNDCGRREFKRFRIFVGNVLMLPKRPAIDEFHIFLGSECYDGRKKVGDDIRMWLNFALDKQAKHIYFCDFSYGSNDFPNFISQSLVTLELSYCAIYPKLHVDLGSLKKLIFYNVDMSEEAFQQFIRGCPSLQELHIDSPYGISNLSFSAPNIRKLILCLESDDPDDDAWLLDFPNLKSLHLKLYQIQDIISIDVSSVQDVYLDALPFLREDENKLRMSKLFSENFLESEVFRLSSYSSEEFLHFIHDLLPLQIKWKRVVLHLQIHCQTCLFRFNELMKSSKDLEEIDIYIEATPCTRVCNTPIVFPGQALGVSVDLPKLKIVTFYGYPKPWKYQLQLVEFFLKSATTLEKLVIVPNKPHLTVAEKQEFVKEVSSLQRASPNARVLFL